MAEGNDGVVSLSNFVWVMPVHECDDGHVVIVLVGVCLHFFAIDDAVVIVPDSNTTKCYLPLNINENLLVFEIFSRIISGPCIVFQDVCRGEQMMIIDTHCSSLIR